MRYFNGGLSVFLFVAIAILGAVGLVGCSGTGDKESLNTAEQGETIYVNDVNRGKTPEQADAVVAEAVSRYDKALPAADPGKPEAIAARKELVAAFETLLRSIVTPRLKYDAAIDFFKAAQRYERAKLGLGTPPSNAPPANGAGGPK